MPFDTRRGSILVRSDSAGPLEMLAREVYWFAKWFREIGPERDVVSVIDPDFIFVRPLTTRLDGAKDTAALGECRRGSGKGPGW